MMTQQTNDPIELFESITSGKLYQIIIGNIKYIKRETRSWVGCDCCGRDIKFGTKNSRYFQKGKSGKRFCIDCFGDLVVKSILYGKSITVDFK